MNGLHNWNKLELYYTAKLGFFREPLSEIILLILLNDFYQALMLFLKAESDLASLIYDTQTDLHQKKLKRSHQTMGTNISKNR